MNEYKLIGSVFGYNVRTDGKTYKFGCGAVVLPIETVNNFMAELDKRRHEKKEKTKQERDFDKVMKALNSRALTLNNRAISHIFKLFNYAKAKQASGPVKKVIKAAPKKAAKKK